MVEMKPKCGVCGAKNVRLYRQYATFRRPETDRCNGCIESDEAREWMVPLIVGPGGVVYGYTSPAPGPWRAFLNLPEKSADHPYWDEKSGRQSTGGWSAGPASAITIGG